MMGDTRKRGSASTQGALPLAPFGDGTSPHHGRAEIGAKDGSRARKAVCPPSEQPEGRIEYDGTRYHYHGCILVEGAFVPRHFSFTADEAGVLPGCNPDRVRAMLDRVGRDGKRQEEIRRFGKLAWHSLYRPESAAEQALDYIFRHDISLVSRIMPFAERVYSGQCSRAEADRWTREMASAWRDCVCYREDKTLQRLLLEVDMPLEALIILIDTPQPQSRAWVNRKRLDSGG